LRLGIVIADIERRVNELRYLDGIAKVEHVKYPARDEFWVTFNRPLDATKFEKIAKRHGYHMVKFAGLPSKLPRGLSEMVWNGVTHLIVRQIDGWSRFLARLGYEPNCIAKIAVDLHGPDRIYIAAEEEGMQLLYEYLDLNYVPPAPLAKPTATSRPS